MESIEVKVVEARTQCDGYTRVAKALIYSVVRKGSYSQSMQINVIPVSYVDYQDKYSFVVYERSLVSSNPSYVFNLVLGKERARFATLSDIMLPPEYRNLGIGRYVMTQLINWGVKWSPDLPVGRLTLSWVDAETDEAKDVRNNFYRKLGFTCVFEDEEQACGHCYSHKLSDLTPGFNKEKIKVYPADKYIFELINTNSSLLSDLKDCKKQKKYMLDTQDETIDNRIKSERKFCIQASVVVLALSLYLCVAIVHDFF